MCWKSEGRKHERERNKNCAMIISWSPQHLIGATEPKSISMGLKVGSDCDLHKMCGNVCLRIGMIERGRIKKDVEECNMKEE
jgi:hypothetical protein